MGAGEGVCMIEAGRIDYTCNSSPLKVNPPKMCQIIGGVLLTLGIRRAVPLIHGSQGCANFVKHLMCRHFKEPIEIATTGVNEKFAAMGGERNLIEAVENIRERINPSLIVVNTTCLIETIGEPLHAVEGMGDVVAVRTASYSGSHLDGYDRTLLEVLKKLCSFSPDSANSSGSGTGSNTDSGTHTPSEEERINLIPGFVNPGDVRELKKLLSFAELNFLTDLEAIDSPLFETYFDRGTDVGDIASAVNSGVATIHFGEGVRSAEFLESRGVESIRMPFPAGIENTDRLVSKVASLAGVEVPDRVVDYRNYAMDGIIDVTPVLRGKRVAIFGDPFKVASLAEFCFELGMKVTAVMTGVKSREFAGEMERVAARNRARIAVFENSDLYTLHRFVKENPVNVILGDFRGKYIAKAEKIPLVRVSFPVCDRFGYHRQPVVGYTGALRVAEEMGNLMAGGCWG